MKYVIAFLLLIVCALPAQAAERNLSAELSGYILLQVESYGRAWYVNPVNQKRYYMEDGDAAYTIMRTLGLGISNADLQRLPQTISQASDPALVDRLRGRIVLQVEEHGEAWYINPRDGLRYYLKDGPAAYELMRSLSLGITNDNLATIAAAEDQNVQDTTFDDVAYVKYSGGQYLVDWYGDEILPPASMTKLMTAMIVAEQSPDWYKRVTITNEILDYPKIFVGNDATSEVDYDPGDVVSTYDLLVALLVASSNQSAAALIESTGMTHQEFVDAMNAKARELGLSKTVFQEAAGLSAQTLTTPKEMAIIAAAAFELPALRSVYAKDSHDIFVTTAAGEFRKVTVRDRNYSLQQFSPDAVKTGFLYEAQRTVVLKKGDDIIVVMHARSMNERNDVITRLLN